MIKDFSEFREIFDEGTAFRSKYFLVFFKAAKDSKVGFTAKRGLGAVERNRLKRILREVWRCSDHTKDLGGHVVLTIREEAGKAEHRQIKDDFEKLLLKLKTFSARQNKRTSSGSL